MNTNAPQSRSDRSAVMRYPARALVERITAAAEPALADTVCPRPRERIRLESLRVARGSVGHWAEDGLPVRRIREPCNGDIVVARLGSDLVKAFRKKVGFLAAAESELDLRNYKALHFEKLTGDRAGQHSIRLNQQWRLILRLETDADGRLLIIIEIVDYH